MRRNASGWSSATSPHRDQDRGSVDHDLAATARAASQYAVSSRDEALEPYLDGLGFTIAARNETRAALPGLRKRDADKARTIEAALKMVDKAYPGIDRPKSPPVVAGEFLAAASSAKFAAAYLP